MDSTYGCLDLRDVRHVHVIYDKGALKPRDGRHSYNGGSCHFAYGRAKS
jgi:hypothetical protein